MKMRDAIQNVDRSDANSEPTDMESFGKALEIDEARYNDEFARRVVRHRLSRWLCTDSFVGTSVFELDGVPVAIGHRPYRKEDEQIAFVSEEAAKTVRKLVLSLVSPEEPKQVDIVNPDEEIGEGFRLAYAGDILDFEGPILIDGRPVVFRDEKSVRACRRLATDVVEVLFAAAESVPAALHEARTIRTRHPFEHRVETGSVILQVNVRDLLFPYKLRR
jgi:hypothetical protein